MSKNYNPVFIKARLRTHWGYIVRQIGASAAQLSYLLPPPSTIVGAFANPLARIIGKSEGGLPYTLSSSKAKRYGLSLGTHVMECALASTLAAGAYLSSDEIGVSSYGEPTRIIGAGYKGGGSYQKAVKKPIYESITELMPVQAAGASIAPSASLTIAWVFDRCRLEECLRENLEDNLLRIVAWSAYRIGSREGIATVEEAESGSPLVLSPGSRYDTLFYQSSQCAKPSERVTQITLPLPWGAEEVFYTPSMPGSGPAFMFTSQKPSGFILREGCEAYKLGEKEVLATLTHRW